MSENVLKFPMLVVQKKYDEFVAANPHHSQAFYYGYCAGLEAAITKASKTCPYPANCDACDAWLYGHSLGRVAV